jgi:hypothetical protein
MVRPQKPAVETTSRPTLRTRTSAQRPVEPELPKRKRRTAEEVQKDKELKEAEQAEQRRQLQESLERIAALEREIEANDANANVAAGMGPTRPIRRSLAFRVEPPEKRLPSEEAPSVPDDGNDENDTDTPIGKGKQKKKAKPSVRASIRAIHRQQVPVSASQDGEDQEMMVDVKINNSSQTRASRNQKAAEAPCVSF